MTTPTSFFQTFVRAVETADDRRGVLGDDKLVFPPDSAYGYWATPRNALTFGAMGVDGVHYAVLTIDGAVTDASPVIHVSPTDTRDPYAVLGASFLEYLAAACGVSEQELELVFERERELGGELVPLLKARFDHSRLYDDERLRRLDRYLSLIEAEADP